MAAKCLQARHVILTGPPGVGKTTLIRKVCDVLEGFDVTTQGFYTEEIRVGGKRIGFDVIPLEGEPGPLARISDGSGCQPGSSRECRVGQYNVQLQSFEKVSLPTLQFAGRRRSSVFVIDEVGKMELFSQSFVRTVRHLFDKPSVTILATIPLPKGKPLPLVEEIRNRKDVAIFSITRENRDTIMDEIVTSVRNSVSGYS